MTVTYLVGDVRERMADIPDGSISLIASSPPFLALRSYLPAGHAAKGAEIGSEANPAAFLDTLLALTAEWGRVLAPWGSIAIELGDTYSGSTMTGGDFLDGSGEFSNPARLLKAANANGQRRTGTGWPSAKSLALIPQLYAVALAYGINPLTGQPSPAGRWLVRNVVVWHRPNPAVGALGDKYRPSTSYIVVATRSPRRWFDLDAVRGPLKVPEAATPAGARPISSNMGASRNATDWMNVGKLITSNPAGAPPLDCWDDHHDTWTITTQPSRLAHYAMWPPKLAERLILSMCPAEVCGICGEPRRRVVDVGYVTDRSGGSAATKRDSVEPDGNQRGIHGGPRLAVSNTTLGWSDCGHGSLLCNRCNVLGDAGQAEERLHDGASASDAGTPRPAAEPARDRAPSERDQGRQPDRESGSGHAGTARRGRDLPSLLGGLQGQLTCPHCGSDGVEYVANHFRPGHVLDPFAGAGTTLAVAHLHGRDATGIDLNPANEALYPARLDECRRALFGTLPEMPGQLSLLDPA